MHKQENKDNQKNKILVIFGLFILTFFATYLYIDSLNNFAYVYILSLVNFVYSLLWLFFTVCIWIAWLFWIIVIKYFLFGILWLYFVAFTIPMIIILILVPIHDIINFCDIIYGKNKKLFNMISLFWSFISLILVVSIISYIINSRYTCIYTSFINLDKINEYFSPIKLVEINVSHQTNIVKDKIISYKNNNYIANIELKYEYYIGNTQNFLNRYTTCHDKSCIESYKINDLLYGTMCSDDPNNYKNLHFYSFKDIITEQNGVLMWISILFYYVGYILYKYIFNVLNEQPPKPYYNFL